MNQSEFIVPSLLLIRYQLTGKIVWETNSLYSFGGFVIRMSLIKDQRRGSRKSEGAKANG